MTGQGNVKALEDQDELDDKQVHDLESFLNKVLEENALLDIGQAIGFVKAAYRHWEKYIDSF